MGIIKLFFVLLGLVFAAGVVFYFSPDNVKEQGLAYISDSSVIPTKVKELVQSVYATPEMKQEELVKEFKEHIEEITTVIEKTLPAPEPAIKIVQRTKEIVEEILEQKTAPSIIEKITETVTQRILKSGEFCPKS